MREQIRRRNRDRALNRTASYDDAALMRRWHEIIVQVRSEFAEINAERRMMDLAVAIVNANPRFLSHPGRRFMDTARNWYGLAMATAVRRQTDNDDRSGSLRVVLEELRVRSSAYRLETLHPFMRRASAETVQQYVMADVCTEDVLNVEIVTSDIDALINVSSDVTRYVNQHVAHSTHDPDGSPIESPTFGEIHEVLERFESIYRRWDRALTGNQSTGFSSDDGTGWLGVFDFPWRYRRDGEQQDVRRYVVTVNRLLDDADIDALYEGDSHDMLAQQNRSIFNAVRSARNLAVDESVTVQVLPVDVTVERLL